MHTYILYKFCVDIIKIFWIKNLDFWNLFGSPYILTPRSFSPPQTPPWWGGGGGGGDIRRITVSLISQAIDGDKADGGGGGGVV